MGAVEIADPVAGAPLGGTVPMDDAGGEPPGVVEARGEPLFPDALFKFAAEREDGAGLETDYVPKTHNINPRRLV